MVKSGLIFGAILFVLVLGFAVFITPFCAPCLGLIFGIAAGYVAGVFDKPINSGESVKKGGIAGAIAGALGFVGGFIGGVINGAVLNPSSVEAFTKVFGINNFNISQAQIWTYQLVFAVCIGLFNIVWMAILGFAGGALWYQISGKNRMGTVLHPQEPIPPST
jgi:hypothetical protein